VSDNLRARNAREERRLRSTDRRRLLRGGRRLGEIEAFQRALATDARAKYDGQRILVVDDFDDGREMLSEYLRFRGFALDTARSGREAIARALANPPHVVLLDLLLPDIEGVDVAREFHVRLPAVTIVVHTADVLSSGRERAETARAAMFIPKPCDLQLLAYQIGALARTVTT
jgi:two-component system, OmpR family, response regulator